MRTGKSALSLWALRIKARMPWWVKLMAKLLLARLPVPAVAWHSLGIFDPGAMDDPRYAVSTLQHHLARCGAPARETLATALEIGPGKTLASAVTAHAAGFSRTYLVDTEPLARPRVEPLVGVAHLTITVGWSAVTIDPGATLHDVLESLGATYLTDGLRSLRTIPDETIDFIWSQAVLEHVRRDEFCALVTELFRVLKPGCIASHTVDLRDHLGNSLNNLRFSSRVWEARWMRDSGFYTNRLRRSEITNFFRQAGFSVSIPSVDRWPEPPLRRSALALEFRNLSEGDLCEAGFDLVATKPGR